MFYNVLIHFRSILWCFVLYVHDRKLQVEAQDLLDGSWLFCDRPSSQVRSNIVFQNVKEIEAT
jgi:hypothetical protein